SLHTDHAADPTITAARLHRVDHLNCPAPSAAANFARYASQPVMLLGQHLRLIKVRMLAPESAPQLGLNQARLSDLPNTDVVIGSSVKHPLAARSVSGFLDSANGSAAAQHQHL